MASVGAPGSQHVAVEQHAAGQAHAWDACTACGAAEGEQCYSLARTRFHRGSAPDLAARGRKRRPCAGRAWTSRRSDGTRLR